MLVVTYKRVTKRVSLIFYLIYGHVKQKRKKNTI